MKKIITTLLLSIVSLIGCNSVAYGLDFSNETLRYVISYKWGLIFTKMQVRQLWLSKTQTIATQ